MRGKDSLMKVISTLAYEAPLTIYMLAKKSNVAVSMVHKLVKEREKGLEHRNVVKAHSERTWRTGMKSIEYILTFRGLIEYFDLLFKEKRVERSEVKKVIQKYSQFYDYPIFTEHRFLEDWLGGKVYDWLCSTAWMLKNHPPPIPIITQNVSGSFPSVIRSLVEGRIPMPIQQEEEIWMHGFTIVFFDLVTMWFEGEEVSSTPNPALYRLVEETYEKLEESLGRRLRVVKRLKEALKNQFSSKPKNHQS